MVVARAVPARSGETSQMKSISAAGAMLLLSAGAAAAQTPDASVGIGMPKTIGVQITIQNDTSSTLYVETDPSGARCVLSPVRAMGIAPGARVGAGMTLDNTGGCLFHGSSGAMVFAVVLKGVDHKLSAPFKLSRFQDKNVAEGASDDAVQVQPVGVGFSPDPNGLTLSILYNVSCATEAACAGGQ